MRCSELMRSDVYTCRPEDRIERCARIMRNQEIGFLPVVDAERRLVGVLTDRDLVVRGIADSLAPTTPVGELMTTSPLVTCGPDDDLTVAEERMAAARKSRIVVIDADRRVLGVISLSDVGQAAEAVLSGRVLREVTRRESDAVR